MKAAFSWEINYPEILIASFMAVGMLSMMRLLLPVILSLLSELLLAFEPDTNKAGCTFVWAEQGVCSICSRSMGHELIITGCEEERTIANDCYQGAFFTACTAGAPLELRNSYGCFGHFKICITSNHNFYIDQYLGTDSLKSSDLSSCPTLKVFNCEHQGTLFCNGVSIAVTCRNSSQQECEVVMLSLPGWTQLQAKCPSSRTVYNKKIGFVCYSGNQTYTTPHPDCIGQIPTYPEGDTDGQSSNASRSNLVFFVAVNGYRAGLSDETQERPLENSSLACKGARIHKSYILTSSQCGQTLQNRLTGSHNATAGLIKVFRAGYPEGIGYITPRSAFLYSAPLGEASSGNAALIAFTVLEDGSPYPRYAAPSPRLDHNNLYLLASHSGNTTTSSCLLGLDSSMAELHKTTSLEHRGELWEGEPVFSLNWDTQPFVLELVGWVDTNLENCGNNFNEDCVSPVTDSVKEWVDAVLSQEWEFPGIPADGCFTGATEKPTTLPTFAYFTGPATAQVATEPSSHDVEKIFTPIGTYLVGIATGAIVTLVIQCVANGKKRKSPYRKLPL